MFAPCVVAQQAGSDSYQSHTPGVGFDPSILVNQGIFDMPSGRVVAPSSSPAVGEPADAPFGAGVHGHPN
jgi:hypothetical protein